MSVDLWEQFWKVLDERLRHLLLLMSSNCPLAIRHKKGEYICRGDFVVRGRFCCVGALELLDCI